MQRLDALDFVQGLRGEVRLAATRARPHGNGLDDQQGRALAEVARNVLQLHRGAAAISAALLNNGRR